jgi:hypothetical protein
MVGNPVRHAIFLLVDHGDSINCFSRTYSANKSLSIGDSKRAIDYPLGALGICPGAPEIFIGTALHSVIIR